MQRRTACWIAVVAALVGAGVDFAAREPRSAPPRAATTVAQPRTDENSRLAHAELVRKAGAGVIDVYFIGDSITRRWGALDYPELLADFQAAFFGWNAANFGWGGDRTENILWRLDHGELAGVSPKVFVVQAGTNNLGDFESAAERAEAVAAGIEAIVERCRQQAPEALVVVTGLFPRRDRPELNASIAAVNAGLAARADGRSVRYVDINDRLVDSRGVLREEMSEDGLHLTLAAYRVWASALQPILAERLGARAERDLAPPPTGNPAAR
jgi:lysophospholipase L1-like esterase